MPGFMDEYLVKLGFSTDQTGLTRFQGALREARGVVTSNLGEMARAVLRTGTEIGAGFAAIGAAAVGMADKVAMADQSYRLFALHMYMSKDTARALKVAMDALGEPLENLTWDAELRRRTQQLVEDQRRMAPGGDFNQQMLMIRNIRFEFTRMRVELQYLGMTVVRDFMDALGIGPADLLRKLQQFNNWVITNMPRIANVITTYLLPVFKDVWQIMKDVWSIVSQVAEVFADLINTIAGNQAAIDPNMTKWEKFAMAMQTAASALTVLLNTVVKIVKFLSPVAGTLGGVWGGAKIGSLFGPEGTVIGGVAGGIGGGILDLARWYDRSHHHAGAPTSSPVLSSGGLSSRAATLAQYVSGKTGIRPDLIWSQWAHETGGFTHLGAANNLAGINVPGGTGQAYRSFSSLQAFGDYYAKLMNSSRYSAVAGSQSPAQMAAALKSGGYYADTRANYARGMGYWDQRYPGNINVVVNVAHTGASPAEIANHTARAVHDAANRRVQRNLQQFGSYGWAMGG